MIFCFAHLGIRLTHLTSLRQNLSGQQGHLLREINGERGGRRKGKMWCSVVVGNREGRKKGAELCWGGEGSGGRRGGVMLLEGGKGRGDRRGGGDALGELWIK